MTEQNDGVFDLLFRDESPDEGYSLLGVALLASLAFHLLFITCIKIKSFPMESRISSTPPTFVTFDTSSSAILVSSVENEGDRNPLDPQNFGFCAAIINEQVPVHALNQPLFDALSIALEENDTQGITATVGMSAAIPPLFSVEVPKIYPITIQCKEELTNLTYARDGSDFFIRPYLECLFAAPSISDKKNSCSFKVTVQGIDGMITSIEPLQLPEDSRLQAVAELFLKDIQFVPFSDTDTLQGTIVLEFSCSYDLLTLLLK